MGFVVRSRRLVTTVRARGWRRNGFAALLGVAVLACPVGMGVMMWMMNRGGHQEAGQATAGDEQVAHLRAEIEQVKADRSARAAGER